METVEPKLVNAETNQNELDIYKEIERARKALRNKILNEEIEKFVDENRVEIIKRAEIRLKELGEDAKSKSDTTPA